MTAVAARVRDLEKRLARPLPQPKGLHLYPEPALARPAFPLSVFSIAVKIQMLEEVRQLKGSRSTQEGTFIFDLSALSLALRQQMLRELQTCPIPSSAST
jgi:hypothetical protein